MADKLRFAGVTPDGQSVYFFHCPGCNRSHGFHVPRWSWNGSMTAPTFDPSLICDGDDPARRCHTVITDGKIHFGVDCHHSLAGQVVEMPDWDA